MKFDKIASLLAVVAVLALLAGCGMPGVSYEEMD